MLSFHLSNFKQCSFGVRVFVEGLVMGKRGFEKGDGPKSPKLHTVLIDDPISMWHKLLWDIDCFQDIQRNSHHEDENEPLAYAALNVCIAATSLGDWVKTDWVRIQRKQRKGFKKEDLVSQISAAVPCQKICIAIANTAKHSEYREHDWIGGEAGLSFEPSDEDSPGGLTLSYYQEGGQTTAYASFDELGRDWGRLLVKLGYAEGKPPSPKWWQQKMRRIFPPIDFPPEGE